jgi:hypothetical protein
MSQDSSSRFPHLPAPCLVDRGTIVDKRDMQRLLGDLTRVNYVYLQDGQVVSEGEGSIMEVFADASSATMVANNTLYINVASFDYLELSRSADQQSCFSLVQENWELRLLPQTNPLLARPSRPLNTAALEAVVADVLSASWDAQIDDEDLDGF